MIAIFKKNIKDLFLGTDAEEQEVIKEELEEAKKVSARSGDKKAVEEAIKKEKEKTAKKATEKAEKAREKEAKVREKEMAKIRAKEEQERLKREKEEFEKLEKIRLEAENKANEAKEKENELKAKEEQIKAENERLEKEKLELEKTKELNLNKIRKEIEEEMLAKMTEMPAAETPEVESVEEQAVNNTPIQNASEEATRMTQDFAGSDNSGFTVTDMDDMGGPTSIGGNETDDAFYDSFSTTKTPFNDGVSNIGGTIEMPEPSLSEENNFMSGGGNFQKDSLNGNMNQSIGNDDSEFYDTFETGDPSMSQIPNFDRIPGVSANTTPEQSLIELKNFWSYNDNRERRTIIADDVKVFGNIVSGGHIEINGEVKGDITAKGKVEIHGDIKGNVIGDKVGIGGSWVSGDVTADTGILTAPDATIVGDLETDNIIIGGSIKGDIDATETAVFDERSVFLGDIKAKTFIVKQGARIKGMVESISQDSIEGTFARRKRTK